MSGSAECLCKHATRSQLETVRPSRNPNTESGCECHVECQRMHSIWNLTAVYVLGAGADSSGGQPKYSVDYDWVV